MATFDPRLEVALAEVATFAAVGLLQQAIKALEAGAYAHARHLMAEASKLARKAQKAGNG